MNEPKCCQCGEVHGCLAPPFKETTLSVSYDGLYHGNPYTELMRDAQPPEGTCSLCGTAVVHADGHTKQLGTRTILFHQTCWEGRPRHHHKALATWEHISLPSSEFKPIDLYSCSRCRQPYELGHTCPATP